MCFITPSLGLLVTEPVTDSCLCLSSVDIVIIPDPKYLLVLSRAPLVKFPQNEPPVYCGRVDRQIPRLYYLLISFSIMSMVCYISRINCHPLALAKAGPVIAASLELL